MPIVETVAKKANAERTCALLEVSRAAYCEQHKHVPSRPAMTPS